MKYKLNSPLIFKTLITKNIEDKKSDEVVEVKMLQTNKIHPRVYFKPMSNLK